MSRRDSDSRRHRSKFDREPSPKRSRRDEKDRVLEKSNVEGAKKTYQDVQEQKQRRRLQDALPLESPLRSNAKVESGAPWKESDAKPSGHQELTKNSSDANEVPWSRSYFQHDEHNGAGQAVRSSGRGSTSEHGRRRDSRDQHDDKTTSKKTNGSRLRNEKPNGDENRSWRHDRYSELEADLPAARKRPAFREMKAPLESEDTEKTAVETAKSSHLDRSMDGNRKKEERSDNRRHLDRSDKQFGGDRVRHKGEAQRGVFPSRERYTNGAAVRNYRGRDRFGERQEFHSSGGRVEKWEHDLYHEANRSPTPKNEEDQIAKVETLLAS
uniref:zinc finger CCCH domain-containing protein 13 isoform X2 n=1 Tax=Fragaria vesca subsp. vesca TaxID=101020 RepID=UPI0005C84F0A|nr:PREDICTED: zinc finger CCCH domain-containing protein 13 isoform X2 [Fragaria vesca subsp. vesca]